MDGGKKRKREKMHHTDCKARMIVKLIGDRWHVIFFAPDHKAVLEKVHEVSQRHPSGGERFH